MNDKQRRRIAVLNRDGHRCVLCGSTHELTLDHKVPRSRGGTSRISNLQTLCLRCNQAKAAKPLHVVVKRRSEWGMA